MFIIKDKAFIEEDFSLTLEMTLTCRGLVVDYGPLSRYKSPIPQTRHLDRSLRRERSSSEKGKNRNNVANLK
ncbi:hypothetical protein NC796_19720 [Aliifodinibius sp. S!AR15-10]|uniref:hypothetical protein n=1 Tax=Aliifodinibius sp. S!AR15-10 TaxID=2950437 RepID=UPI0028591506|nr:hypothetical protein [Aliifodinibius sp. S!AR15-10]MDR8393393.1 hypothetical protein [Aliifodinibius sp. S!AR15-10]